MTQEHSLPGVVIIGAGQAGGDAAAALRQQGYQGAITLVGEEPLLPYRRPPLSKAFLLGEMTEEQLQLKPAQTYQQFNIHCRLNERVEGIDRQEKVIHLAGGTTLPYSHLILSTGGQARRLEIPGSTQSDEQRG